MPSVSGIAAEYDEAVLSIWRRFAGDEEKARAIIKMIGFSWSPDFSLEAPKPETPETKIKVQNALEKAARPMLRVTTLTLSEIQECQDIPIHLCLKAGEAYRRVEHAFRDAYHECTKVVAGSEYVYSIKDWYQRRHTPPADWENQDARSGTRSLKRLWNALTCTIDSLMTHAVGDLMYERATCHDFVPWLNLYREGVFPFGIGAKGNLDVSEQQSVLVLCSSTRS